MASNPMPAGSGADGYNFTITGTDDTDIGPITFTQMGVYTYEITNTTDPGPGYTCDPEAYTLKIYADEDLKIAVVAYDMDENKVEEIKFTHTYSLLPSDPGMMPDPPVVKTVAGNPAVARTFIFNLTAEDLSNPMPAGSMNGVKAIQIAGSGWASFGTWSYTAEGTYRYRVTEVNSGASGYIYDTAVYSITDSVKALNGQLTVTRVVTTSLNKQVTTMSFINTFRDNGGSKPAPYDPPATPSGPSPTATPSPPSPTATPSDPPAPYTTRPASYNPTPYDPAPYDPTPTPAGSASVFVPTVTPFDYEYLLEHAPLAVQTVDGPKTGDESNTALYAVLSGIAGITALGSACYLLAGKRNRKETE